MLRFPAVWLRDNCPCAECLDPGTGQKLNDITELPDGLAVRTAAVTGESVTVTFAPDGHRSVFPRIWLAEHALPEHALPEHALGDGIDRDGDGDGRTEDSKELWRPADLARLPEARWPRYLGDPAERARALDAVLRLLHCLRTADDGGDTGLVDGFAAARELRTTDRKSFELIAGTPVPFGYQDKNTELRASQPLIQLSPRGRIRGIRFNNRSMRPLRLPYAEVTAFYAAYRTWAELLARPERQLNLRLAPGDCLIFDNTRVLHARTEFSVTGGRYLQGCYADLDGLASTLRVLRREETL